MKHAGWDILINKIENFELKEGITSFVNPYSIHLLKTSADIATGIDHWHVDGIWLVKLINRAFKKNVHRYSFDATSVAPLVFEFAKKNSLPVALIGTKKEYIDKAAENIVDAYAINATYVRDGYFSSADDIDATINHIKTQNITVVVCGMGTPKQEEFLIRLKNSGWKGYGYTCGGYLHQSAQKVGYYPEFYDRYNLRWVYRIYKEPKLFSRYFIKYPLFFIDYMAYVIKNK